MEQTFPISIEVSDARGIKSDGLDIDSSYIKLFTDENLPSGMAPFVTDVSLKLTLPIFGYPSTAKETLLSGITNRASDKMLSPESGLAVVFYEGHSWDDFRGNEAVCLSPYPHGADNGYVDLTYKTGPDAEAVRFTIIGHVYGGRDADNH